jgi:hypothetical protein
MAGDQQAALFGQACTDAGMAKNTYGTGSFVLLNTGAEAPQPPEGLLTTVGWGIGERVDYALEAAIFVTGAAVQWLRDGLGVISEAAETEAMAARLEGNDDVYFVPALTGLGSPHWDPYARGTIVGLTRGTGRDHLARAALEAMAYQTVDAVQAQEAASGRPLEPTYSAPRSWSPRSPRRPRSAPPIWRASRPASGAASRWGRCGASPPAMSPAWARTSGPACSPAGGRRWPVRVIGHRNEYG